MYCPKCGGVMTEGVPHSEGYVRQWECHNCGKIIPIAKDDVMNR